MARKFWLRNSIGETIDLNGKIFLSAPSGLGYQISPSYSDYDYGFFRDVDSRSEPQQSIVGNLVFVDTEPYEQYNEFVNWIGKSEGLELLYQPKDIQYCRKVELGSISKGERARTGWLQCPVTFTCLTPWYRNIPITIDISDDGEGNVSRFDIVFPFVFVAGKANQSIEVKANGQLDSGFVVEITGQFTNPVVVLSDLASGEEYGRAAIDYSVGVGEKLILSTQPDDSFIEVDGEDIINYIDITHNAFPLLPKGKPCLLSITGDASLTSSAMYRQYDYYRSV